MTTTYEPLSDVLHVAPEFLDANCVGDYEVFFADEEEPKVVMYRYRAAKQICATCAVRMECLAGALERHEAFGVWGGLTPMERKRLKRSRRR